MIPRISTALEAMRTSPEAEIMGETILGRYNNLHPDELHKRYIQRLGLEILPDGTAKKKKGAQKKKGRGAPRGQRQSCGYCGEPGHKTPLCPLRLQEGGMASL